MAHIQQFEFISSVKNLFPNYFCNSKVLEIGSLNINGSVRQFFENCDYTGIDVAKGTCVDIVSKGEDFNAENNSYDVGISCECFEHNPHWIETFSNMIRMTKNDGIIIMTCASDGRAEHGTARTTPADSPLTISLGWNYYKNLNENDFRNNFDFNQIFKTYNFSVNNLSHDLYFYGIKN